MKWISAIIDNRQVALIVVGIALMTIISVFIISTRKTTKPQNVYSTQEDASKASSGENIPFFACPFIDCTKAVPIYTEKEGKSSYLGVGISGASQNSPIWAVISGTYTSIVKDGVTILTLKDEDGLEVTYTFKGEAASEGKVNKGENIGTYKNGTVKIDGNSGEYSLIISVLDSRSDKIIPLGPDVVPNSLRIL